MSQLQTMFAEMRAKAPWNIDGPLLWGYFFLDPNPTKLRNAALELQTSGYKLVSVQEVPGRGVHRLHVEKIEVHTAESLYKRNMELYDFAEKHSINSYDGMDVGAPPK